MPSLQQQMMLRQRLFQQQALRQRLAALLQLQRQRQLVCDTHFMLAKQSGSVWSFKNLFSLCAQQQLQHRQRQRQQQHSQQAARKVVNCSLHVFLQLDRRLITARMGQQASGDTNASCHSTSTERLIADTAAVKDALFEMVVQQISKNPAPSITSSSSSSPAQQPRRSVNFIVVSAHECSRPNELFSVCVICLALDICMASVHTTCITSSSLVSVTEVSCRSIPVTEATPPVL